MMKIYKLILVLSILLLIGCEKSNDSVNPNSNKIIGYWINPEINDTIWKLERTNELIDNEYGFTFKSGQVFIERKNAGWCGTPPISYEDFEGSWSQNDSIINITVGYWGGLVDYQWKIISIDAVELTIHKIKEEYHSED